MRYTVISEDGEWKIVQSGAAVYGCKCREDAFRIAQILNNATASDEFSKEDIEELLRDQVTPG